MRGMITFRGAAAPGGRQAGTPNRSRCGSEPISVRNTTDLDAEVNRSRRGSEPISTKGSRGAAGAAEAAGPGRGAVFSPGAGCRA
mgnify:CR=1 FL=1